jgi:hypothetical protein
MKDRALCGSAKVGDIITFGMYPQTADGADGTPIQWRVLQNSGGDLFVMSEYILNCKRYHGEYVDTTWRDCDMRKWLSDGFYNGAFSVSEKEFIRETHCTNNGEGSPDTEDKVFLLSVAEVKRLTDILGKDFCRAAGTEFARATDADGCHLYVYDKSIDKDYLIENGQKHGCSWWWLRTQLREPSRAAFIGTRASIRSYGRVNLACYGVRPAIMLNLRNTSFLNSGTLLATRAAEVYR